MMVEPLEGRKVLSGSLFACATPGDDAIVVQESVDGAICVSINGFKVEANGVKTLVIETNGGHDTVRCFCSIGIVDTITIDGISAPLCA